MLQNTSQEIYVALLAEGTDVWKPVQAILAGDDLYQIISQNAGSTDERWEFGTGDVVRCVWKTFASGATGLVAVERVTMATSNETQQEARSFRTLRGFLAGEEADEESYFAHSATLRISGDSLDYDDIGHSLRLSPTHSHRRGERPGPRSPEYSQDMWVYSPSVPEDHPLAEHIDALWVHIKHAKEYLRSLKKIAAVDVFLGYRSNIDTAGIEVPYTCLEMFVELEIPFGVSIIIA